MDQHLFRLWLLTWWHLAMTWGSVDHHLHCHVGLLGYNELNWEPNKKLEIRIISPDPRINIVPWVGIPLQCIVLTHWGRDKMAATFQTTFSNAFSWMKMYEFQLRFHWSLFLRVQLTIFQHWVRQWLGADQATSHCLTQWRLVNWRIYTSLDVNELTKIIWD